MVKQKAEQAIIETTSENITYPKQSSIFSKHILSIILLAILFAGGYAFWKKPQLTNKIRNWLTFTEQADPYATRFNDMQNKLADLQNQLNQTNYKLDNSGFVEIKEQIRTLEKMNLNMIDSKADVAAVLGVITRMDAAEQKINNLSEITDTSALILTATLLVKDAADRGQTFEYEAEVLSQITADSAQASAQAQKIRSFATSGLPSYLSLSLQFERIYNKLLRNRDTEQDQNQTWKERINNKLNEIVQIKKVNEKNPQDEANLLLKDANTLIKNNELLRATNILKKANNPEISASAELQEWINLVEQREDFYRAISALSADSLAALKVNSLKKVRGK